MPYCPKCGTRLPEGEEVRFCPCCGASLATQTGYGETEIVEVKAPQERKMGILSRRITVVSIVFILCVVATFLGTMSKMDPSEAQVIVGEEEKLLEGLNVELIFGHNLMLTLIMFIPGLGTFQGFSILYNTGRVFAAASVVTHADPLLLFVSLFIIPVFWLEYVSYSLAISESLLLVYAAVKRRFRNELINASKFIAICAVLLLLAAFIEMALISPQLT